MKCKYCKGPVEPGPGAVLIEELDEEGPMIAVHEECWQMSGDDEGFVRRRNDAIEELE